MMHHPGQQAREEKPSAPTQDTYSYLSNYLWKSSTPAEPEKRVVVSYSFDKYDHKDFETRNCLIITYENGFHIWDIEDTNNIFEVCSHKSSEKKKYVYSKILPTPHNETRDPVNIFSAHRPVLISYDGEDFLSWTSLSTKHEDAKKLNQQISGIDANRHVICIGFESAVCVLSALTFGQLATYNCCPNDLSRFTLGSRWLAYSTDQTSVDSSLTDIKFDELNYSKLEVAKDFGNKFFSSLYNLTDITTKTVAGIVTGEGGLGVSSMGSGLTGSSLNQNPGPPVDEASQLNQSSAPSTSSANSFHPSAGIIGLVDVTNPYSPGNFLTFRADNQPVSKLIFSPSGDLLCCSANSGKSLNIFQILVTREPNGRKKYQVRHLYHLYRGSTSAQITSIDFSCDSNWLTVCSSHGTAHLFAINPSGGEVDKYTHGIGDFPSRPASVKSGSGTVHENQPKLIKLSAVNRIKSPIQTNSIASFYLPDKSRKVLTFNPQNGVLTLYELKSPAESVKDAANSQLVIEIIPKSEWHLIRKDSWNAFTFTTPNNLLPNQQNSKASSSNFASFGEIVTFFSTYFNPVMNRSVFVFKVPKTSIDNEVLFQSVQVIPSSSVSKANPKQINKLPAPVPISSPNNSLAATVDISRKMEEAMSDPPRHGPGESYAQPVPLEQPVRERKPEQNSPFAPVAARGFFDDEGPSGGAHN